MMSYKGGITAGTKRLAGTRVKPRHSPYYNYLCRAPDIAAVENSCSIFSYEVVLGQDLNPLPT